MMIQLWLSRKRIWGKQREQKKENTIFFYTSNLQGLTIQQYKNKKNFWNTDTKQDSNLEEILYISQQGFTRREHINKLL